MLIYSIPLLFGRQNVVQALRTSLNDSRLFDSRAPRTYLYSDADRLVRAKDVHEHLIGAKEAGYLVDVAHFGKSGHVAHVNEDPQRYWHSIDSIIISPSNGTLSSL